MPLRVLVVPDKFKGTLTARQAADAIVSGWQSERPDDLVDALPMSDGGDGFGEVVGSLLGAERRACTTVDAAGRPRHADWWLASAARVAIVETAQANGLALLPRGAYHPFRLDSFGLGAVLADAARARAAHVYVGLGGSATNDGGFGLARALGFVFLDEHGLELSRWGELERLARVAAPAQPLAFPALSIAADVTNPLLGENGATYVYGPQKGLTPGELPRAEACLARLAEVVGAELAATPGAGAAGGLGFAFQAFLGGKIESGAGVFARLSDLERRIRDADIILTGEGRLDAQSFMGKGVGLVAAAAASAGKPCWCLAGDAALPPEGEPPRGFRAWSIAAELGRDAALREAREHLRALAVLAARARA